MGKTSPVAERLTRPVVNLLHNNDQPGVYPGSWYRHSVELSAANPALDQDIQTDVCVIGGGFTGLSTALHLARKNVGTVLLEAHRIGWGASGRNGGQAGKGFSTDPRQVDKLMGMESGRLLWKIGSDAVHTVHELSQQGPRECHWRDGIVAAEWKPHALPDYQILTDYLKQQHGFDGYEILSRQQIAERLGTHCFAGGCLDHSGGHLHPLAFACNLADLASQAGARLHENTEVVDLCTTSNKDGVTIRTAGATVTANFVVLACNGYLGNLHGEVRKSVMPINNFMVATEPLDAQYDDILPNDNAVYDSRFVVNYFRRSHDGRLLFGGGESYGYRFPDDIRRIVRPALLGIYPQLKSVNLDYAWGGTLAITRHRIPCFRRYGPVFSASGYSGHGVAMATQAGKVLADVIGDHDSTAFDALAAIPMPSFPGGNALRSSLLALAMSWYALRDRIG